MYPISFQTMYWQLNVLCLYIYFNMNLHSIFFFRCFFSGDACLTSFHCRSHFACICTYLHSLNNLCRGKSVKIKVTNWNVAQIDSLHCKYLSSLCIRLYALMITMYRRINSIFLVYILSVVHRFFFITPALENRILY